MRDFGKMILVLFIACGFAAASLAVVNMATRQRIAVWEKQRKEIALRAVFGDADEFKELTADRVWEARRKGQAVGHAFLAEVQGYSGPITLVFGVDGGGAVTGLRILGHTETPGLGAKITTAGFLAQFKGKRREQIGLKRDDPRTGQMDAITGATISSRAVAGALRTTLDGFGKDQRGDSP
jgi:electron transport complex protein RnfG